MALSTFIYIPMIVLSVVILAEAQKLDQIFNKLKISQEVVPYTSYTKLIKVELNGNYIKPGDPIPARNFKNLDFNKITWEPDSYDARYTVMLVDLDRKSHQPNSTQNMYNQFTSINIPGNIIQGGQTIVAFDSPSVPCQPSSKHRLVLLAFQQDQNIDLVNVADIAAPSGPSPKRENVNIQKLVELHRLELTAANVFLAIGESNGICSGAMSQLSIQGMTSVMIVLISFASIITFFAATPRLRSHHIQI